MDSDLRQYLEAMEGRLHARLDHLESRMNMDNRRNSLEDRVGKLDQRPAPIAFERFEAQMRETQAVLLRAFAEASEDRTIRFRLLKDDQPGLDATRS